MRWMRVLGEEFLQVHQSELRVRGVRRTFRRVVVRDGRRTGTSQFSHDVHLGIF